MSKAFTFYACSSKNNFGDMITPYILKKLGYESELNWHTGVILDGSVLGVADIEHHIFGAGFMDVTDSCKSNHIHYVRGRLSRHLLMLMGRNIDGVGIHIPAFCLAEFIKDKNPVLETGIAHHYVDYSGKGINVCNDVEVVVNEILDYKNIITSSLHAYIVARMYGRGACLVRTTNPISGDGTKYIDAMSCFGEYPQMKIITDVDGIKQEVERTYNKPIKFDNKQFILDLNEYLQTI